MLCQHCLEEKTDDICENCESPLGCPSCDNHVMDLLEWQEDDHIICLHCQTIFDPDGNTTN